MEIVADDILTHGHVYSRTLRAVTLRSPVRSQRDLHSGGSSVTGGSAAGPSSLASSCSCLNGGDRHALTTAERFSFLSASSPPPALVREAPRAAASRSDSVEGGPAAVPLRSTSAGGRLPALLPLGNGGRVRPPPPNCVWMTCASEGDAS